MATQYGTRFGPEHGRGPGRGHGPEHEYEYEYGYEGEGRRRHLLPAGLRAPFEGRSWRELAYVLLSLPMGILLFVYAVTMASLGAGLLVTFLGIPVLAGALAGCRLLGVVERARARGLL
ncbi:sensor histidine kinase, partial [Streptomyces sp. SID5998]|nr:sensor histidine kinase [Streptomyces sp. SID5998]